MFRITLLFNCFIKLVVGDYANSKLVKLVKAVIQTFNHQNMFKRTETNNSYLYTTASIINLTYPRLQF